MTSGVKYALYSVASGALSGAIGASAATGAHPILKGALITGAISGACALFLVAVTSPEQIGVGNGPPRQLRFP
jgi:ammonia channel protein AmtB